MQIGTAVGKARHVGTRAIIQKALDELQFRLLVIWPYGYWRARHLMHPNRQSRATIAPKATRWTSLGVLPVVATLTVLILFLPRILLFAKLSTSLVAWRWQFDYDEGINLYATMQLAKGADIYRHNGAEGFISAPYPPLFYLLNVPFVWLGGPSFGAGRAISLLSTLFIASLLVYIVRNISGSWWFGLLSGTLWLSLSPVIVWSAFYKQDMLALALGLAGLAWAVRYPGGRKVYVAAVLFALAFYTKQSALSAAAATTLWLLLRDRYAALRFGLALILLILGPFLLANLLSNGGLWEHLVVNQALPWSVERFWWTLGRAWSEYWPLITWGGMALCWASTAFMGNQEKAHSVKKASCLADPRLLVALYTLAGVASTLVQIGSDEANFNHLLDGLLTLCLVSGLYAAWLWSKAVLEGAKGRHLWRAGLAFTGLLLLAQLISFRDPQTWFYRAWPNQESEAQMRKLSALVASTPGDIYSEDLYLLLSNGHRVLYDDPSTLVPLANSRRWDESRLNKLISDHHFSLVVFWHGSRRWTHRGLQAFSLNYVLRFHGSMDVYVPAPVQTSSLSGLPRWWRPPMCRTINPAPSRTCAPNSTPSATVRNAESDSCFVIPVRSPQRSSDMRSLGVGAACKAGSSMAQQP